MKRKSNRRGQAPKPRGIRPRAVVFEDPKHLRDVSAARGDRWMDADLVEEIDNWKEWL